MDEQVEGRIEAFTENVVQVVGIGLPRATVRTVIEGLATRFALDVQRDATTTAANVPTREQIDDLARRAEQADPLETTEDTERWIGEDANPVDPPIGTPWGDDQPKPQAALTTQKADPT